MSAKKAVTKREVSNSLRMGPLQLPPPLPGDKDTLVIDGFPLHACFGDIFEPIAEYINFDAPIRTAASAPSSSLPGSHAPANSGGRSEWVPLMSNFPEGQVMSRWVMGGGNYPNTGVDVASLKDGDVCLVGRNAINASVHPDIRHAIPYRYDKGEVNITADMDLIAQVAPQNSLVVIPAIGTNNGVSFAEAAGRLFYSIISALNCSDAPLRSKLKGILFISPVDGAGARTISHIINLFNVYRETRTEPDCPVCFELKQDMIISCGHRFCCRCILRLPESGVCPTCRAPIRHMSPCHKLVDSADFDCCGASAGQKKAQTEEEEERGATSKNAQRNVSTMGCSSSSALTELPADGSVLTEPPAAAAPAPIKKEKAPFVFVPCGHINSLCEPCSRAEISARAAHTSRNVCKVCGEPVMAYLRIYS
jgi:hypothetical protein